MSTTTRQKLGMYLNNDKVCAEVILLSRFFTFREVYNIVDDDPAPREEVFEYATRLVEKKWPGLKLQSVEQRQKEWSNVKNPRGEKRLCNARMKRELGVQLLTNQD